MPRTPPSDRPPVAVHSIEVRVRYPECDPMGVVHHAVYPIWFEMGRTEMLRAAGGSYRDMEAAGVFLAVARLEVRRLQDVLNGRADQVR
jgi:acyl-CoA thioester hydrolase